MYQFVISENMKIERYVAEIGYLFDGVSHKEKSFISFGITHSLQKSIPLLALEIFPIVVRFLAFLFVPLAMFVLSACFQMF
jgi:hypothetical protein